MTESQIFSHTDWHAAAPGEHSLPAIGHGQPLRSSAICSTYWLQVHAAQSCRNWKTDHTLPFTSAGVFVWLPPELVGTWLSPRASETPPGPLCHCDLCDAVNTGSRWHQGLCYSTYWGHQLHHLPFIPAAPFMNLKQGHALPDSHEEDYTGLQKILLQDITK